MKICEKKTGYCLLRAIRSTLYSGGVPAFSAGLDIEATLRGALVSTSRASVALGTSSTLKFFPSIPRGFPSSGIPKPRPTRAGYSDPGLSSDGG